MLKVRKWSDTSPTPWDVVFINGDKTHYQPGAVFSTPDAADKHLEVLQTIINDSSSSTRFIIDNWPTD